MGEIKEAEVPDQFRCPISLHLMKDPVILSTGITYDRRSIEAWLSVYSSSRNNIKCPVTNKMLSDHEELIPNHLLRRCIQDWCLQQASRASGSVERNPYSGQAVDAVLAEVNSCKSRQKMEEVMQNIGSTKLAVSVVCGHSKWATQKLKEYVEVFEEALRALVMISPLDEETCRLIISSSDALFCITRILVEGSRKGKENAVLILEELVAADPLCREKLRATEGLAEGLVKLLRNDKPLSPTRAKEATITIIYHIAADEFIREKLVEVGAITLLLEIIPQANRNVCETSLGALDKLCNCAHGRSVAYDHDLAVHVVSQKILRVSDLASEFAVSILWTLCRYSESPSVALEAIQEGAIQKLLLLMQIGCGQQTRKRASQLLGLFNHYRQDKSREWEWRRKTIDFGN